MSDILRNSINVIKHNGGKIVIKVSKNKVVRIVASKSTTVDEDSLLKKLAEIINSKPYQIITLQRGANGEVVLEVEESLIPPLDNDR